MERARQSLDNIIKGESINPSQILFVNNRFPSFLHIPRKYLGPFHLFIRKTERTLHDRGIVRKEPISEKDIILKIIPDGKSSYGKIIIRDAALQKYMEDLEQCLDETLEWWSNSVNEKIRTNHGDPSVHLVLE